MTTPISPRLAEKRQFREDHYGLFIHFGLYSLIGRSEWIRFFEKIPREQYRHLMHLWSARDFDAKAIAQLAVDSGMRYVSLTSKHHEGFALFDSKLTTFTSVHSAAKRDLIAELAEACHDAGLKFFPYYSLPDWDNSDYDDNFPAYRDFVAGQIRELCTNYGPLAGLWLDNLLFHCAFPDGEPKGYSVEQWDIGSLYEMIHKLQPGALICQNLVDADLAQKITLPPGDDLHSSEQTPLPGDSPTDERPIEVCATLNLAKSWGYCSANRELLTPETVAQTRRNLKDTGFNYLLNIGPLPFGGLDPAQSEVLIRANEIYQNQNPVL